MLSVTAEGADGARFAEWTLPQETDRSFKPGRERFQAFARAVRKRDSRLLFTPLAEGRVTSALLRLSAITAQAGRPLRFDPIKERLIGESPTLQDKLG